MPLSAGSTVPDLSLPAHDGCPISLAGASREGPGVLLFFPLAFTDTCAEELCTVGDDLGSYAALDARVFAISVDSPYVLERFRTECGADYPFLSDFNREASEAFGVLRTAPLGPGLRGVCDRAVFVVHEGVVRYAWHSTNPGLLPPFAEIKEALAEIRSGREDQRLRPTG